MPNAIADTAARLESLLRLRSFPFAMKLFADRAEMEAIPRIRRPTNVHTLDQVVAQAARLGWTVGVTAEDLVGAQCRAVVGLGAAKDAAWRSGRHMSGVWFATPEDAAAHLARLRSIPGSDRWIIVSIQGLHRFYRGRSSDVVASWMTRQDR